MALPIFRSFTLNCRRIAGNGKRGRCLKLRRRGCGINNPYGCSLCLPDGIPLGTDTEGIYLSPAYQYNRQYTKFNHHLSVLQKFTQNHHEKDNPVYIYMRISAVQIIDPLEFHIRMSAWVSADWSMRLISKRVSASVKSFVPAHQRSF